MDRVSQVFVSTSALRTANDQQVETLWSATEWGWWEYASSWAIASKRKSVAVTGLRKLLAFKNRINDM